MADVKAAHQPHGLFQQPADGALIEGDHQGAADQYEVRRKAQDEERQIRAELREQEFPVGDEQRRVAREQRQLKAVEVNRQRGGGVAHGHAAAVKLIHLHRLPAGGPRGDVGVEFAQHADGVEHRKLQPVAQHPKRGAQAEALHQYGPEGARHAQQDIDRRDAQQRPQGGGEVAVCGPDDEHCRQGEQYKPGVQRFLWQLFHTVRPSRPAGAGRSRRAARSGSPWRHRRR